MSISPSSCATIAATGLVAALASASVWAAAALASESGLGITVAPALDDRLGF
jgi:hypothetical protein